MAMHQRVQQMPHNPMAMGKFPPPPPPQMTYKNPMMQMNRGYAGQYQQGQQQPMNQMHQQRQGANQPMYSQFHHPPPPPPPQGNHEQQNQGYQSNPSYDQYYHR